MKYALYVEGQILKAFDTKAEAENQARIINEDEKYNAEKNGYDFDPFETEIKKVNE